VPALKSQLLFVKVLQR